jgi:PAS domain S-box-containing protein
MYDRSVTGQEVILSPHDTIQSRTDIHGMITYANPTFARISGFRRDELIGAPHSIVRHPWMPRGVFHAMWEILQGGDEFFGFVNNRCKNGDNYWVLARVAPHRDAAGEIDRYSSVRIRPSREAVAEWEAVYERVVRLEQTQPRARQVEVGYAAIVKHVRKSGAKSLHDLVMRYV